MGIFDKIKHAIFGEAQAASTPAAAPATPSPAGSAQPSVAAAAAPAAPAATAAPSAAPATVDVEPILDAAVKKSGQKLDWRHSVVDLMKAVGLDATLEERKELATELHYDGDTHDSAKMNTWLHKALLQKLAANGGKVPAELTN